MANSATKSHPPVAAISATIRRAMSRERLLGAGDGAGGELRVEQLAVLDVLGRVDLRRHEAVRRVRVPCRERLAGEQVDALVQVLDRVVPGDHPVALGVVVEERRGLLAQRRRPRPSTRPAGWSSNTVKHLTGHPPTSRVTVLASTVSSSTVPPLGSTPGADAGVGDRTPLTIACASDIYHDELLSISWRAHEWAMMATVANATVNGRSTPRDAADPHEWCAMRPLKTSESVARDIVDDIVVDRAAARATACRRRSAMLQQYGVSRETLREASAAARGAGPDLDPAGSGRRADRGRRRPGQPRPGLDALLPPRRGDLRRAVRGVGGQRADHRRAGGRPTRTADLVRAAMTPYLDAARARRTSHSRTFVVRHTEFHTVVGSLARNKVLQLSLMAIGEIVTHHVINNADPRDARNTIEHDHSAIAQAIVSGYRTKARAPDAGAHPEHHRPVPGYARRRRWTTTSAGAELFVALVAAVGHHAGDGEQRLDAVAQRVVERSERRSARRRGCGRCAGCSRPRSSGTRPRGPSTARASRRRSGPGRGAARAAPGRSTWQMSS